jgi:hypothetical protein
VVLSLPLIEKLEICCLFVAGGDGGGEWGGAGGIVCGFAWFRVVPKLKHVILFHASTCTMLVEIPQQSHHVDDGDVMLFYHIVFIF